LIAMSAGDSYGKSVNCEGCSDRVASNDVGESVGSASWITID